VAFFVYLSYQQAILQDIDHNNKDEFGEATDL